MPMKRYATFYSLNSNTSKEKSFSNDLRKNSKKVSPSDSVIRNILNYSKALVILNTNGSGIIRLVMN
jgi:hypothetical protein